jgi:hypothetical protein
MNAIETEKVIGFIKVAYKDTEHLNSPKAVELWSMALADISFTDASHAVSAWICEERWPPTIADIRAKVYNLKSEPDVMASQAWNQLLRALRDAYAPNSEEVWNELPETTRLIVGGYATFRAWGNTDTASLESVQRPMFMKRFEEYQRRERKEAAIPRGMREPLPSLSGSEHTAIEYKAEEQVKEPAKPSGRSRADDLAELRKRLYGVKDEIY